MEKSKFKTFAENKLFQKILIEFGNNIEIWREFKQSWKFENTWVIQKVSGFLKIFALPTISSF